MARILSILTGLLVACAPVTTSVEEYHPPRGDVDTISMFANALEVPVSYFFEDSGNAGIKDQNLNQNGTNSINSSLINYIKC